VSVIGVPYAPHAHDREGEVLIDVVVCPACGKRIWLKGHKDWESFRRAAYLEHYAREHAPKRRTTP